MSWLAALATARNGLAPNGTAAVSTDSPASRPSQVPHSAHAIRQPERPRCPRCHRGSASHDRRWPAYCSPCVQLLEDVDADARRELDDARAEDGVL